jgi:hypothetical protein
VSAALEAYQRLLDAQRNRPQGEDLHAFEQRKADDDRRAQNARMRRRLPKVV